MSFGANKGENNISKKLITATTAIVLVGYGYLLFPPKWAGLLNRLILFFIFLLMKIVRGRTIVSPFQHLISIFLTQTQKTGQNVSGIFYYHLPFA